MEAGNTTYTILGAARSGLALARLLRNEGRTLFVSDASPTDTRQEAARVLQELGIEYEFGGHTERVLQADVLALSPGVPDTIPIVQQAVQQGMMVTNEVELAAARCKAPIVAITGTNGKTTTTELIGFILRQAGRKTFVAGNVGLAFSEIVAEADEESVVVLELSSFQLEHIAQFRPHVAVVLNVTPDHMDRYENFDAYAEAKFRITMNQRDGDALIINGDDKYLQRLHGRNEAKILEFAIQRKPVQGAFEQDGMMMVRDDVDGNVDVLIPFAEIGIQGTHNRYNAMAAALAVRYMGIGDEEIRRGLRAFPGVPHRLEEVRVLEGVRYVNDSKATNVDSLWYALTSFSSPVILIAGGKSKKNEYGRLLPLLQEHVKAVVLIGDAADEMEAAFTPVTSIVRAGYSMEEAVTEARRLAEPGEVVLLSPACASFDMFNGFEHRGDVFRQLVMELK